MFMFAFKHLTDEDKSSRSVFYNLCSDDSALVRRSAVTVLCNMVEGMSVQEIVAEILPIFKRISVDDQVFMC